MLTKFMIATVFPRAFPSGIDTSTTNEGIWINQITFKSIWLIGAQYHVYFKWDGSPYDRWYTTRRLTQFYLFKVCWEARDQKLLCWIL